MFPAAVVFDAQACLNEVLLFDHKAWFTLNLWVDKEIKAGEHVKLDIENLPSDVDKNKVLFCIDNDKYSLHEYSYHVGNGSGVKGAEARVQDITWKQGTCAAEHRVLDSYIRTANASTYSWQEFLKTLKEF